MKKTCPKCKKRKPLTRHHIIPRRLSFTAEELEGEERILRLCHACHVKLEQVIARMELRLIAHYGIRKEDQMEFFRKHRAIYVVTAARFVKGGGHI